MVIGKCLCIKYLKNKSFMQKTFSERCNLLLMMRMNVFQITDPYRPMYVIYARWSLKKIMREAEINFYMINAYR